MQEESHAPELFRLMYGEEAERQWVLAGERLKGWAQAFEGWLESIEHASKNGKQRSVDARSTWRSFLRECRGAPWLVRKEEVEAWVEQIQKRGLTSMTIYHRIAWLVRFYRWVQEQGCDPDLPPDFNPARGVRRPKADHYPTLEALSPETARLLLQAVAREGSLVARRDYAMILLALRSGLESGQIRMLCWERLKVEAVSAGGGAWLERPGPQKRQPLRLADDAWRAIQDYLRASGRLEGMQPGDYLFVPLADPLTGAWVGRAEAWDRQRPVSMPLMTKLLSGWALRAGLEERTVTWHALQHTAVLLKIQGGAELEELEDFLGKPHNPKRNEAYLRRIAPQLPGLRDPQEGCPGQSSPAPGGADLGSASPPPELAPGFYAPHIPRQDLAELQAHPMRGLSEEIDATRFILREALENVKTSHKGREKERAIESYLKTGALLANLFKADYAINPRPNSAEEELAQDVREVADETGWDLLPKQSL